MSELVQTSAAVDVQSRVALSRQDWEKEQLPVSSEPIIIVGEVGKEEKGELSASFVVRREIAPEGDSYIEVARTVNLGDIQIRPGARQVGLGKEMMVELERQGRLFGAKTISGKVTDSDVKSTPWLLDFYRARGFTVSGKGHGWEIVKILDPRALR